MSVRRQKRKDRNGTYRESWVVDVEHKRADGTTIRVRRVPRRQTRAAAEKMERELLDAILDGTYGKPAPVRLVPTLEQFAVEFLKNYVDANNKPSEVAAKRMILSNHLLSAMGTLRLDTIGPREIESYKAQKLLAGYKAKSLNNHLAVLGKLLHVAVDWQVIAKAPQIKRLKALRPEIEFLGFDEAPRLVAACEGQWRNMVAVTLNTGLRLGELLALRWEHIDLDAARMVVRDNDWRGIIGATKGHKPREIPLNGPAMEALKAQRHLRGKLVFCRDDGKPLAYNQCRRPLTRACKLAGIKPVQWHALRHTFASHLVMRGVTLRAVQELLGHATQAMTERYAHLTPDFRRAAVEMLTSNDSGPAALAAAQEAMMRKR